MLVIPFCIECRLEQQRAHVPPIIYLPVQRVQCCLFLAPGLGCGVTLCAAFSVFRSIAFCQRASTQVVLRNMPMAPDTAVIVCVRSPLFPDHCATPFVVRQMSRLSA